MKKRILTLLLACVMLLSMLAGCSSKTTADPAAETTQTDAETTGETAAQEASAAEQTIQVPWAASNFYSFDNNKNYAAEEIQIQSHCAV